MNCETAREHLLEADLADLRGEGAGELAQHVRACRTCGERAREILQQTTALAATLERATPRRETHSSARPRAMGRGVRLRRWVVAVPLALAASLAVLVLARHRASQTLSPTMTPRPTMAAAPFDVQVPAGRSVSVFQTDNPNIVVIWSF